MMYTYAEWPLNETRGARSRGRDGIDRRLCVRRDRARRGSASRDLQDARVDAPTHAKEERRPRGRVPSRRSGRAGAMPSRGTRGRGREAEAVPPRQWRAHPPVQKGSVDADAVEGRRRRRQHRLATVLRPRHRPSAMGRPVGRMARLLRALRMDRVIRPHRRGRRARPPRPQRPRPTGLHADGEDTVPPRHPSRGDGNHIRGPVRSPTKLQKRHGRRRGTGST